jgi:protein-S-isoprenylcysteine O-methyltransferase Ste14
LDLEEKRVKAELPTHARRDVFYVLYLCGYSAWAPDLPQRRIDAEARSNLFGVPSIEMWPLLLSLSVIAGPGSFAWGLRGHFVGDRTPGAVHLINALSVAATAVFLFALWEGDAPDWRRAAGFCLHLLAIALFVWAILATRQNRPALAFAGKRPNHVFSWGPYAYIRHPFYTAYLLFWLGCVVATSSLVMVVLFVSLAAIYTLAALGEERNFLRSSMRDEYEAFRNATGFFWPKLRLARRQQ